MEFTSASDDSLRSYTELSFLSLFISVCETVRVDGTKLFFSPQQRNCLHILSRHFTKLQCGLTLLVDLTADKSQHGKNKTP